MYLCVDIGGTKTLLAVFSPSGQIIETQRFPTPKDYDEFLNVFKDTVLKFKSKDFRACGIGVPAKLNREKGLGVAFGNLPWQNVPIQHDLEKITNAPVVIENDSKLAGLSEALLVINEFKKALYVTIGTGIGTAFIINGMIDENLRDSEAGFMLLEHKGKMERWEDFASGAAIFRQFGKPIQDIDDPTSLHIIARNIALGLIDLVAALVPEVIIIGGGVGAHLNKFQAQLDKELKLFENPMLATPVIRPSKRPTEAVVYGCYELAKARYA